MSSAGAPNLNSCGCCQGLPALSPEQNVPGLPAISYRIGTYATFLQQMLAQISSSLPALTTRSSDDPSIALLDAWAVVADILRSGRRSGPPSPSRKSPSGRVPPAQ